MDKVSKVSPMGDHLECTKNQTQSSMAMITASNQLTTSGVKNVTTTTTTTTSPPGAPNCSLADDPNYHQPGAQMYVQLSTFWYVLFALITLVGLLVSLVSNMIIIFLFSRTPSLRRNPSNIVAVNLSLSDLLYCLQWPSVIYCSMTQSTWLLEINFVCQSFGFITVSTASASVLTVLIMSIERAIVIRHSIHVRNRFTIRTSWLLLGLIWLVSILTSLPPLFGKYNRYTLDLSRTSCTIDYLSSKSNYKLYIFVIGIIYWIAPAIIITICYVLIIITFKRSSQSLKQVSDNTNQLESQRRGSASTLAELQTTRNSGRFHDSATRNIRFCTAKRRIRDSIRLKNYVIGSFRRYNQVETSTTTTTTPEPIKCVSGQVEAKRSVRPLLRRAATGVKIRRPPEERRCSGVAEVTFEEPHLSPTKRSTSEQHQLCSAAQGHQPRRMTLACLRPKRLEQIRSSGRHQTNIHQTKADEACETTTSGQSSFQTDDELESSNSHQDNSQQSNKSGSRFNLNNLPFIGHLRSNFKSITSINCSSTMAANNNNNNYNPNMCRTTVQIRLAKMSFYLILLWLISWTPIASLAMINSIIRCHQTSAFSVFLANTMTKLGPTFDVFIYGISHPKIKTKFRQIIRWMFCIGNENRKSVFSINHAQSLAQFTERLNQHQSSYFNRQLSLRSLAGRRGRAGN